MKKGIKDILTLNRFFVLIVLLIVSIVSYLGWHFYRGYNLFENFRVSDFGNFKRNLKDIKPEIDLSSTLIDLNVLKFNLPTEADFKIENYKNQKSDLIILSYEKFKIFLSFPKIRPPFLSTLKKYDQNIPRVITRFSFDKPIHRIDTDNFNKSYKVVSEFDYYERWIMRLNSKNISFWKFILSSEYKENKYIFETYCRQSLIFDFQFKMETKSINSIFGVHYLGGAQAKIYSKDGTVFQEIYVTYISDENKTDSKVKTEEEILVEKFKEDDKSKIKCSKIISNILSTFEFKLKDVKDEALAKTKILDSLNSKK